MNSLSPLVAWLLVVATIGIAAFFVLQQFRTLDWLRGREDISAEDATYFRRQVYRRLFGCAVLVGIGGLIGWSYISGQEEWAEKFGELQVQADQPAPPPDPEIEHKKRMYAWYWISVLLLLLALVVTAFVDFLAIRKFGARHMRIIRDDRKAMLERELEQLRRAKGNRNGQQ